MTGNQQMDRTTDALRLTVLDLDRAIETVRGHSRRGRPFTAKTYLSLLREVHELQDRARTLGAAGPLLAPLPAVPFSQNVGLPPDRLFAANWRIDCRMSKALMPKHLTSMNLMPKNPASPALTSLALTSPFLAPAPTLSLRAAAPGRPYSTRTDMKLSATQCSHISDNSRTLIERAALIFFAGKDMGEAAVSVHAEDMHDAFRKVASALGYRVEPIDPGRSAAE